MFADYSHGQPWFDSKRRDFSGRDAYMLEYPHYDVWIDDDCGIMLPEPVYAVLKFSMDDTTGRYVTCEIEVLSRAEAIFRYLQYCKYLTRAHLLPTALVVSVSNNFHGTGYHRNSPPTTVDGWTHKIDWYRVLRSLLAALADYQS